MKTSTLASSVIAALGLALPLSLLAQNQSNTIDSGSGSATARQSGSTSGSATSTSAGLVIHNGTPYIVRNNQATRLDATTLQSGQMMTADGRAIDIPKGIAGLNQLNSSQGGSENATARQSGAVSGSATGENTQDGIILKDGVPYIVHNGRAKAIDTTTLPDGQMMTFEGQTMAVPSGVTGLDNSAERNRTNSTNSTKSSGGAANRGSSVDSTESPNSGSPANSKNSSSSDSRSPNSPGATNQTSGSNSSPNRNPSR